MSAVFQPPVWLVPEDLLRRMDVPGPRYTSYPTADRFVDAFGPEDYRTALRERVHGLHVGGPAALSLYVHIPFCESVCYYCACNKVVTRHHAKGPAYLDLLEQEVRLHVAELGTQQVVSQLHLGGGTPTFLSDEELSRLMGGLRTSFRFEPGAEVSIEVDPRTVTPERLQALATLGFNRISFGIQDVDPDVQRAIHRVQPFDNVRDLMHAARAIGFQSINADLIYGLPRQTAASFEHTVRQVASLRPDRIALYAYAHLPARFMPQRRIASSDLPSGEARLKMLSQAMSGFMGQGYTYIGMDHFAVPSDALAVAKRQGRLHRNFQGYSTQPDCDLLGLGVSAIGRIGPCYSQNARTVQEYEAALRQGQFPTQRGLRATRDDLVRRAVIMSIMCQGRVDFEALGAAHLIDAQDYFARELEDLRPYVLEGLVTVDNDCIEVTPLGWFFVRGLAMVFDQHLRTADRSRFSRII
ncbi:MAG: oxygen-independent coproporphyrinogen III oxidase [Rubrivivax sp.]